MAIFVEMFCVTFCTLWLLLTYLQFTFLFTFSDMKLFVCILTDETDFDLKRIYIFLDRYMDM